MSAFSMLAKFLPAEKMAGMIPINAFNIVLLAKQAATATAHAGLLAHECAEAIDRCAREKRDMTEAEVAQLHMRAAALYQHATAAFAAPPSLDIETVLSVVRDGMQSA